MAKVLCIYHGPGCADGLGAAWAVHRALGSDVEFVAAKYGEEPPYCDVVVDEIPHHLDCGKLAGRDILIVDFSFPLATLRAMAAEARSVLVLDHHKTAQEDLAQLSSPPPIGSWKSWLDLIDLGGSNLAAIFDLNRSGAGIAWDYLHPHKEGFSARIIDLVEDRDLWRFKFGDESRAFHAVLASYDWTDLPAMFKRLDHWHFLDSPKPGGLGFDTYVLVVGRCLLRAERIAVERAVRDSRRTMRIADHVVPVANVSAAMASEAGHLLCQEILDQMKNWGEYSGGHPFDGSLFSATYYDGADGRRHFSLRSPEGGADVGDIANRMAHTFNNVAYGNYLAQIIVGRPWSGGGHEHAAGFDAPLGWDGE